MTQEALKLALEALESSDKLINGSGNHFGLEGAMDGYYSGCFDVGGNNKLLNKAITAIKEALAQPEQEPVCPECKAEVLYECVACSRNNYPPQRTWQGMTDEDKHKTWYEMQNIMGWYSFQEIANAIEAKLKERNI